MSAVDEQADVGETGLSDIPDNDETARASVLSGLKEKHKEVKRERHLDLDIPGYGGELFARFVPYEVAASEKRARKLQQASARGEAIVLRSSCDTIIDACEQLFVRAADGRELPIDKVTPVKFEKRLAELLGFDRPDIREARHVVLELFPTQQAILRCSAEITEWLTTANSESDEEFLGESKGTMP